MRTTLLASLVVTLSLTGVIHAAETGVKDTRLVQAVKTGDTVYYGKYSGTDVEVDGEKLVILRESDILGVLE